MLGLVFGQWPMSTPLAGIAAILAAVILVGIFVSNIITIPILSYLDPQLQTLIIVIIVFGLVFLYVTYESEGKKTWGEQISSLFKEIK
jgi:L-lactate permease